MNEWLIKTPPAAGIFSFLFRVLFHLKKEGEKHFKGIVNPQK